MKFPADTNSIFTRDVCNKVSICFSYETQQNVTRRITEQCSITLSQLSSLFVPEGYSKMYSFILNFLLSNSFATAHTLWMRVAATWTGEKWNHKVLANLGVRVTSLLRPYINSPYNSHTCNEYVMVLFSTLIIWGNDRVFLLSG